MLWQTLLKLKKARQFTRMQSYHYHVILILALYSIGFTPHGHQ